MLKFTYTSNNMKKVIIVDDDVDILEAVSILLQDEDYSVVAISDEEEAQQIVKKVSEVKPDAVLLDIFIGNVDGRELCKALKSNPQLKDTPVILMSAHTQSGNPAAQVGADAYISKPFEINELVEVVNQYSHR